MEELFNAHGWKITIEEAPLPDGRTAKKVRGQYADTAHILAFDNEGNILLLREFRPFYQEWIWLLPSGHVDKETDHMKAAMRELQEETGFAAKKLHFLWKANNGEKLKMTNHFFEARDLFHSPLPQDAEELIEVHPMTPEEAIEKILHSPVVHLASAYGLLRWMKENS